MAHKPKSATPLLLGVLGALAATYAGGRVLLERRGGPVLAAEDRASPAGAPEVDAKADAGASAAAAPHGAALFDAEGSGLAGR